MPLPLGHTTIGLATQSLFGKDEPTLNWWRALVAVSVLANLPDVDVLFGLILKGNGDAFHRGPTHSLLFALVMGLAASNAWRLWLKIPKLCFTGCFMIILSHVLADLFLTSVPVSFLWPLGVSWSSGHSGLTDVLNTVLFGNHRDLGIFVGCGSLVVFIESAKRLRTLLRKRLRVRSPFSTQPETKS